jgi:succinate dehydrogenase / fumarate reductase flavoprotein subunit
VSQCVALAALTRQESRGGHTRDDFPGPDPEWATKNLVLTYENDQVHLQEQPLPVMPDELKAYFEEK